MNEGRGNSILKIFVALLAFLTVAFFAGALIVFVFSYKERGSVSQREEREEEVCLEELEPNDSEGEILSEITVLNFSRAGTGGTNQHRTQPGLSNEYVIAESDRRLLTYSDIAWLSARELNYAKNEIYARHGRRFRSGELQSFFNGKSWYTGLYEPDEFDSRYSNVLSEVEKKNIDFLKKEEEKKGGYSPNR